MKLQFKLNKIRPATLGQALRIDGVTPAAAIILLSHIKKVKNQSFWLDAKAKIVKIS